MAAPADLNLSRALLIEPVAPAAWLTVLPVALCLAIGALLMMIRYRTRLHGPIAVAGLALLLAIDLLLLRQVWSGGPLTMVMGRWLPPFGIAFTVDLTGALFATAAAAVALAGAVYALPDLGESGRRYGFYPFLMVLMAGVSGAFLTGDIFNLYVWFEVLLISSFGLMVLGSERAQIDGALKYAILNLIATTLFLIAVGYLYGLFGTLNMADIARKADDLRDTAPLKTLAVLFFLAFGMKAAAFPVNFWLPASYHTPRIAVSALFAGLLTKVGVYALLRVLVMLLPVERDAIAGLIALVASLTMLFGALGALAESELRRLLGYVVIAGIGYMIAGLAIATPLGLAGALFYALHSVLLMTALYLAAGLAASLGGLSLFSTAALYSRAPLFALLSLALFFAAAGLPPFSGFWPKAMLVKAALDGGEFFLAAAILVSGFLVTIALARVFLLVYWRDAAEDAGEKAVVRLPRTKLLPLVALSLPVLWFGLFPEMLVGLVQQAATDLADPTAYYRSVFGGGAP